MKMNIKNIWKNNEAVSPVIAVILMVAITVVLAAVLYVWAAGLASTGGSAPSAFSADVTDAQDTLTTYSTGSMKNFISITGTTIASNGSVMSSRATLVARYFNSSTDYNPSVPHSALTIAITFKGDNGTTVTSASSFTLTGASSNVVLTDLGYSNLKGISQITSITVTNGSNSLSSTETVCLSTESYDTIVKIKATQGKPGDITKMNFYIKVGATGDSVKLTADASYRKGAVVLENAATDTNWDTGETVYLSEDYLRSDIVGASTSSQQVYVYVIQDQATIFESKNACLVS